MGYLLFSFLALAAYYLVSSIRAWHRLRHFKGPPLGSFSYLWMAYSAVSGKAWKLHADNAEKYGSPFVRIGPNVLITDDAEMVRRMNAARSPYKRDTWYYAFRTNPYSHSSLSTIDDGLHNELKTKTVPGYSGKDVPTIEDDIAGQVEKFKSYIRGKYLSTDTTTKPIDFGVAVQYFTLDAITKVGFGKEWGFLDADSDVGGFIRSVNEVLPLIAVCCDVPWVQTLLYNGFMLKLMGPKETDKIGMGKMMGCVFSFLTDADRLWVVRRRETNSFVDIGLSPRWWLSGSSPTRRTIPICW